MVWRQNKGTWGNKTKHCSGSSPSSSSHFCLSVKRICVQGLKMRHKTPNCAKSQNVHVFLVWNEQGCFCKQWQTIRDDYLNNTIKKKCQGDSSNKLTTEHIHFLYFLTCKHFHHIHVFSDVLLLCYFCPPGLNLEIKYDNFLSWMMIVRQEKMIKHGSSTPLQTIMFSIFVPTLITQKDKKT